MWAEGERGPTMPPRVQAWDPKEKRGSMASPANNGK